MYRFECFTYYQLGSCTVVVTAYNPHGSVPLFKRSIHMRLIISTDVPNSVAKFRLYRITINNRNNGRIDTVFLIILI